MSRVFVRYWLSGLYTSARKAPKKALIYGAGKAGQQLADAFENNTDVDVVGFLDDDRRLHGRSLNGAPIYKPEKLISLVELLNINDVYLAMPGITRKRHKTILALAKNAKASIRTLPSLTDLAQGKVTVSDLRELNVDELLGREPVEPNQVLLAKTNTQKTVLVTGAGGSIGGELCRQIISLRPKRLILLEQNESALYEINKELGNKSLSVQIIPLIASVQNKVLLESIMSLWEPDTVYHAAAYKHVPLVEQNISEGLKNNVIGTLNTLDVAIKNKVQNFVLISTDKAVRPTNIMGASKRLAEMLLQARSAQNIDTKLSIVRFGNVLDSSGSVVPRFREQIKAGGPVTLTHPEITRFFMTIPEAAQLVIQAGAMAKGGDVFLLDMGEPVKIVDLARRMIELSGLTIKDEENADGDIEISIVGLRPGEKLFEELLIGDASETTIHPRIMRASEDFVPWAKLKEEMVVFEKAANHNDVNTIRLLLQKLIVGYSPPGPIIDLLHVNKK